MNPITALKWASGAAVVALLIGIGFYSGYSWVSKDFEKYKQGEAAKVSALEKKASEVTIKTVTQYVDRVKTVREAGQTIIKKVPVYVPRGVCTLPPGFRSLHDAAATGVSLPDTPGDSDAAPVDAQDATETVTENYSIAHLNEEQLKALQDWLRGQQKASLGSEAK